MAAGMASWMTISVIALSIGLMLLRPRGIREVYWVAGGAALLLGLRLVPLRLAGHAIAEGTDVYFFLIGMMLLSELAREHGVFDWLAAAAVRGAHGSCSRLFALVYGAGTVVTILMSNDATAVVLTPAILTAVRKANVKPMPHLFACAMIANAASFVLPISNPANLVVFHTGMPALARWFAAFGVPSIASIAVTFAMLRWVFRDELRQSITADQEDTRLTRDGKLVVVGLGLVVSVLLVASAMRLDLGLPTLAAALIIALGVSLRARENPLRLAAKISWETIALVAGLFILVDAAESIGALGATVAGLERVQRLGPLAGALITSFTAGFGNNLINNLPLGLIAGSALHAAHAKRLIANAVLIGVDLGPNLSITGSLATILWLLALRRERLHAGFWGFLKVGIVVMPAALLASTLAAIAMNYLE